MIVTIITQDGKESHVENFNKIFDVQIINQKENGLWIRMFPEDPKEKDIWVEYDPDYDIINIIK